jgi:hypothetical protein
LRDGRMGKGNNMAWDFGEIMFAIPYVFFALNFQD